jgi:hypothetical protein
MVLYRILPHKIVGSGKIFIYNLYPGFPLHRPCGKLFRESVKDVFHRRGQQCHKKDAFGALGSNRCFLTHHRQEKQQKQCLPFVKPS